ncbi:transcription factor RelB [Lagenorhynchus albirostris]|uniref:transcription factor RelB n=1 Tax=Lagenorhynchus albirostris TaxID=27610 RepID=UPI0028C3B84F|nr:transcription factor RelB [Delphinus delphis]XP_059988047.1 transcription factor RelB [Lagenorhynchus albirostris]
MEVSKRLSSLAAVELWVQANERAGRRRRGIPPPRPRPPPARPGPAPPATRAPRVQPGLRPQPLRRSPDPRSSARPCHLAARPARVCVFWSGLASGPSVPTGWAMPSRRVARSSAAPELGALGAADLSSLSLAVSRTTEIIDEYIKENGFGLEGAQPGPGEGLPRLVSRGAASLSTVTLGAAAPPPPATPPPWGCPLGRLVPPAPGPGPRPHLIITEQPKQRGMRFRYECEGRSAGSILGESSTEASKTLPAIELRDCGGLREVEVTACLVWKDWPHRVHPHSLVGKDCTDGVCRVRLRPHVSPRHSFNNLGIQCVRKKEIEAAIERKIQLGIDPYNAGSLKNHQEVDMNVVRICFQASYRDQQGQMRRMDPVLSEPVYDKKSTNTSELRICRINKESGPCTGGEELYLLCDKVQKEDISVVFSRASWEGRADFSQADVHRQIAIVFKTPPYEDLEIVEPVTVNVFLQRLTDGVCSEPLPFTYLPRDHDSYGVDKKRKRGLPDVLGELNSSDPHGIESKRRRKKPVFLDHFLPGHSSGLFLPPSALLPDTDFFPGTVSLPGLEPPCEPDLLDDGFAYDPAAPTLFTMLDMLPPAPPLTSAVAGNGGAGAAVGEPPGTEPLTLDSYQSPGPGDGGTASLVGSNMFPNQYREAGFGGSLLSPGPEAT